LFDVCEFFLCRDIISKKGLLLSATYLLSGTNIKIRLLLQAQIDRLLLELTGG
jgi:hypothetical protein